MRRTRFWFAVAIVLVISVTGFSSGGQTQNGVAVKINDKELVAEVEKFLDEQAKAGKFSGAVLIAKDGKPIFKQAYGPANKSKNQPNKVDTKFVLGSMNKMFTAVAITQLAEQGKLWFDDKVGKHLPNYPNKVVAEKVTIHQLLTHSSGLGDYFNDKFPAKRNSIRTVADYLSLFVDDPLVFEPGTRFQYSNAGFIVLGAIIEKVSGQSYYDYVREHIYKPAGMKNSDDWEMTEAIPNAAMGYALIDGTGPIEGPRRENTDTRPNKGGPAGGGYSTVEDLLSFANALLGHKLLTTRYTNLMLSAKVPWTMGGQGNFYAYGFVDSSSTSGHRTLIVGHTGGAPGIAGHLTMLPELGYTVAGLSNYGVPALAPVMRKISGLITGP